MSVFWQNLISRGRYYFWASYRRKILDRLQTERQSLYYGVVLDIGGRDRGRFVKPRARVERWIFADIEARHRPDLVLDVSDMNNVGDNSIDVVNAIELFEHVERIEQGIKECWRVLKPGGTFIVSMPFLSPVHSDPYDFQRWTEKKWRRELTALGFTVDELIITGGFFTVSADCCKRFIRSLPVLLKYGGYLFFPLLDLVVALDKLSGARRRLRDAGGFHGGYFIISRKTAAVFGRAGLAAVN